MKMQGQGGGSFNPADVMEYAELPQKDNFHFRNIQNMKFYPALNTQQDDVSQKYNIKLRSVYILADFVDFDNKAVCVCIFILIYCDVIILSFSMLSSI